MFKISGSKIVDKNKVLVKDEALQRQIAINLQNKFAPISKAIFREQQALRYPNTISISNEPTLGMLIANNKESAINSDSLQSYSLARNQLLTIADSETTDYILDRLDDDDIQNLNQKFPSFIKTLTEKYKNIDKNKFIQLIKIDSTEDIDYEVTDRGEKRINREKTDAEVRKKIIEDRDEQLRSERFSQNTINREQFEEYQYDDKSVTPTKNPQKNKTSPYLSKTVYGNILNQELFVPSTDIEEQIYRDAFNFVAAFRDKRALSKYISTQISGTVPQKFSKQDLKDIAFKLRLKEELSVANSTEGRGLKRLIEGRGIDEKLSRNPDKVMLNNGKFIMDMEKLRRNILSVSYASCRASIPQLKKENVSNDVKNILKDIIENKYNANLFNKMKSDDQRIVSTFVRMMKIPDIDMKEFDQAYQLNYEILLGQVNSGQNNPIVKRELKEYILRAISEGLIPKSQGYNKLFELSL
jgi:phage FluMu protein gp41